MRKHANRTYLFSPGNHKKHVKKAINLRSDIIILDLQIAVSISEKMTASDVISNRFR
jgi:Citrate lyase beta subunit